VAFFNDIIQTVIKALLRWIIIILLALVVWYFGGRIAAQIEQFITGEEAVVVHPVEMIPFLPEHIKARFVPPNPASGTIPNTTPNNAPKTTPDNDNVDSDGGVVACTMDAKICPDGSAVGRVGPHCEFAACPTLEEPSDTPNASGVILCESSQRTVDACAEIYQPVCGLTRVECITEPCDPVPSNYSNSCFACQNERVVSYTEGMCQ
jgi:hypothetical protein